MEYCLETKGLTKHFGANQALENVNLTVAPGRVVGLLGPNGSGKTTLIKLANGLLTPTAGELRICGALPGKGIPRSSTPGSRGRCAAWG